MIIEVKANWNDAVYTSMKDQLVDRYLIDNACHHGLYVVGCFSAKNWDDSDSRKRKARSRTAAKVSATLAEQAHKLSQEGVRVKPLVIDTELR